VVEIASLPLVFGEPEDAIHVSLLEAVRIGLILRLESSYAFLHDRIQEAAYSLIPEGERAEEHLRIGRKLLAAMSEDQLDEHLFDVANQLNRGAERLTDRNEKAEFAAFNLRTGRRAKASAAYASAGAYFAAGMALLDETSWSCRHELTFSLWLECAECEFLNGHLERAEQLIVVVLERGLSNVDQAASYNLKILIHTVKSESTRAVDSALTCLRLFGIYIPVRPTWDQVQTEYETIWQALDGHPIESLIDLPLMTDRELQAAMQVISTVLASAYVANLQLLCLLVCRMVNISMQHGASGALALGCGWLGTVLGPVFHRYPEGYRFGRFACDLVDKHGFVATRAKVYFTMGLVSLWTQPITTALAFLQEAFRSAIETGDLAFACYCMDHSLTDLLLRNDPLDSVGHKSQKDLDFVRKAKFHEVADIVSSQQRFIATMQGRTGPFFGLSEEQFDEAAFEARLSADQAATMVCWYWIIKLKTRFLSGDHVEALAAAGRAKPLLSASAVHIHLLDYFYYTALTVTALFENASAGDQQAWRDTLAEHQEQLREWAENYPPTFADKYLLVSAEIARVEGRAFDAMQLYERAIQSARENSFVQNEALAHEVAARFYLACGFETIAHTYLRNARYCYDRWGALGKVKQLDERYPRLQERRDSATPTATMGTPVGQLDVETIVRASQALSSEMVLDKLIEKLMRIALEHAGAERGLLILLRGDEPRIEAEARNGDGKVEVAVRQAAVTPSDLPRSALQYVIRTRERVLLDDASIANLYSEDPYVRTKAPRSVLCLPIVQQTKVIGILYLENNLTPRAFTSNQLAVLELLASQASISLENAGLYADLQRNEAYLAQGQSISHTGSFGWNVRSGEIFWSEETHGIFELDRRVKPTLEFVFQRFHPADKGRVEQALDHAIHENIDFDLEHRLRLPSGGVKHIHVLARALSCAKKSIRHRCSSRSSELHLRCEACCLAYPKLLPPTPAF
jgi:GAF domain-containing protein